MESRIEDVELALRDLSSPENAKGAARFFKSGEGEYGEGDMFIGVKVPDQRAVAKDFWKNLSDHEMVRGLRSPIHEVRLTSVFMLIHLYKSTRKDPYRRAEVVNLYCNNLEGINNWDLVDSSCHHILGDWLMDKDRTLLYDYADSGDMWKQRIAMVTTYAFIRKGDFVDTLALAEVLLFHSEDLIHKAVGWMLREMGNRNEDLLRQFLENHAHHMPRTALRYSIEKLDKDERQFWMDAAKRKGTSR